MIPEQLTGKRDDTCCLLVIRPFKLVQQLVQPILGGAAFPVFCWVYA